MTDVMRIRVAEKKSALSRGSWVRMRGGERNEYRDDLAQVPPPLLQSRQQEADTMTNARGIQSITQCFP